MTKLGTVLLSFGIIAILIAPGCAQSPTDVASPPEASSEQPASESQTLPLDSPDSETTPDTGESTIPDEPIEPTETILSMGRIEVRVTDAPPRDEVTSILVTVAKNSVQVHKAVAEQEQEQIGEGEQNQNQEEQQEQQGGESWLTLNMVEGAEQFDLLEIRGLEEVLAVGELEAGKYTQIRISVESVEVTFGDDEEYREAEVTGGELKFVRPFDVVEGETTILLLDFDAEKSINDTGQGKVHVKPVVKLTIQQGRPHEIATVEGTISEADIEFGTASIIPDGETEAIVLDIIPQTEITLDDVEATLDDLDGLEEGNSVIANYYLDNFKAIRIDAYSP
jgi:PBP1b-binding outer membrane lipoprotein LpoB